MDNENFFGWARSYSVSSKNGLEIGVLRIHTQPLSSWKSEMRSVLEVQCHKPLFNLSSKEVSELDEITSARRLEEKLILESHCLSEPIELQAAKFEMKWVEPKLEEWAEDYHASLERSQHTVQQCNELADVLNKLQSLIAEEMERTRRIEEFIESDRNLIRHSKFLKRLNEITKTVDLRIK